jgi:hypothetical protein
MPISSQPCYQHAASESTYTQAKIGSSLVMVRRSAFVKTLYGMTGPVTVEV